MDDKAAVEVLEAARRVQHVTALVGNAHLRVCVCAREQWCIEGDFYQSPRTCTDIAEIQTRPLVSFGKIQCTLLAHLHAH